MNSLFSVRPAHLDDAEAIGILHTQTWKTTYQGIVHQSFLDALESQPRIAGATRLIQNPEIDVFVLIENQSNTVVGFATLGRCREKNVDADGELYAIYILQEHQNFGGGKLLFEAGLLKAQEKYKKMMVSVLERNMSSRKFYERLGGKCIGSDHVDLGNHRYPTSTYLWIL